MANNITRWDPFREMVTLRDAMDSLFQNAMIQPFDGGQGVGLGSMPVDVSENGDNFVVRAAIPGVSPDDLDVSVMDNVLTIQAQTKSEQENNDTRYHVRELRTGTFQRQIALPVTVDADHVQAEYADGIVTLTLPKSEQSKPKRIAIRANGQKILEGKTKR